MSDKNNNSQISGIEQWVEHLSQVELPVLATVIGELNQLAKDADSSANHLAEVILRDATLTSKVLRIANSIYYQRHANGKINTISSAVVKLGFNGIRAISLSVMLVESLLKNSHKDVLLQYLSRAFHAAVQAKQLSQHLKTGCDEEVFIAGLLLHVGEMAVLSARDPACAKLSESLMNSKGSSELLLDAQGTRFRDLTLGLAEEWSLSDLLVASLDENTAKTRPVRIVQLADEISRVSEGGWQGKAVDALVDKLADFTQLDATAAKQLLLKGSEQAVAVALSYGAKQVCHLIPTADTEPSLQIQAGYDEELKNSILAELNDMASQQVDVNTIFQMLLEGLHRGVGLSRVAICLANAKQSSVSVKYLLGENSQHWREQLALPVVGEQDNVIAFCLHNGSILKIDAQWIKKNRYLFSDELLAAINSTSFFMASLYTNRRMVGVVVADLGATEALTEKQFEAFGDFIASANRALIRLADRSR